MVSLVHSFLPTDEVLTNSPQQWKFANFITTRNSSCGKVMFSQASVNLFTTWGWGISSPVLVTGPRSLPGGGGRVYPLQALPPSRRTTGHSRQAGGTHSTEMISCVSCAIRNGPMKSATFKCFNSVFPGLFAVVFKDKKEAAFSGLKMFQSLGACLNFATAKYMCTRTKIYIVGGLLVWAMLGVTLLEIITNRKERREKEAEAVCDDSLPSKSPPPADSGGTQNGAVPNGPAPGTEKKPLGPTPV